MNDISQELQERVKAAEACGTALNICGGGTKAFLGREPVGEPLTVAAHRGIVSYEPTELVITARAGTPLGEIEATLAAQGQTLPFEPPYFGESATLGGTIACGLSGPARPFLGSARDFVLGTRIIDGRGENLRFGGEVMKNVAGYDVSRLMVGAMGTLGVLLEVSLKVLPRPATELTLGRDCNAAQAVEEMNRWAGRPLPITAACYDGERLFLRLAGAETAVKAAHTQLGGEILEDAEFWSKVREQRLPFFGGDGPLWRLSLPPAAPPLALPGSVFVDWGGAQRWLRTEADAASVRGAAEKAGGHAMLFRGGHRGGEIFHPLVPALATIHKRVKQACDPMGIFNPGRMYADL